MPRAPQLFTVPAGTPAATCRSCRKQVWWITTQTGRRLPIDCRTEHGILPRDTHDGRGVAHSATCPDAKTWRHPRSSSPSTPRDPS